MSVNFSPNGQLLAGCFKKNPQYIYSFSTLEVLYSFDAGDECRSVRFSNDSKYVAWALKDTKIILMNANTTNFPIIANFTSNFVDYITEIDFSSDSNRLLACGKGGVGFGH